ncbi:pyruvate ferredoxin oxidoreductase [candidate division WOR-3 bacterium 4484_100]|uniref:Pyruvate ferredoxin oxidoreductase n=1 Tax=candidate division WOR-3 bacterium 4484_100 TaxID=1936077 RepID=A0A1V4QFD8_UNCW3|nr:MAG: pyruvate ferredoxin oxidoreductase [candidate division WOR-3 bacterium 4484_100]
MIVARTGNEAMAEAMRQINPDVVAAYPITPATEVVQLFAKFVSDGKVDTEFVPAESEHSAISACCGASAAGARVMTSTASQGLALMHEILYIAAGLRLPIVICLVNRSLSSPINIHCDHSDSLGSRDSGWIQIFSENTQEAYDSTIQAVKIAESALLPAMVTTDGFILSHGMERIELLNDQDVPKFLGERKVKYSLLDVDNPITLGPLDLQDYFFEHKRSEIDAMNNVLPIIEKVQKEFGDRFGRFYPVVDEYKLDDAEVAILVMGSTGGTAKVAVERLREKGKKVGLIRARIYRPFPKSHMLNALKKVDVVGIMDRSDTLSTLGGHLYNDCRSILYDSDKRPLLKNFIYGLGGRDITIEEIESIYENLFALKKAGKVDKDIVYFGVREE